MSNKQLLCRVFGHKWEWCKCKRCGTLKFENHKWDDRCVCSICGRTRDQGHNWYYCKCKICGMKRDEGHKWDDRCVCSVCGKKRDQNHSWDYCRCRVCGQTRNTDHKWSLCQVKCEICGAKGIRTHKWEGCRCSVCGETRQDHHNWIKKDCTEKCSICGKERESHEYQLMSHEVGYGTGRCYHVDSSDEIYCLLCKTPNACLQYPQYEVYKYKCVRCGKISVEHEEKETTDKGGNSYINDLPEADT